MFATDGISVLMAAKPTEFGMASQPHPVGTLNYRIRMKKPDSKLVLWENVSALMKAKYGRENLTRLAAEAKVGPGTVSRIKAHETSVGLDVVEAIARIFKVEPWQLLVPGLDVADLPAISIGSSNWPFAIDRSAVLALTPEQRGKIEGYIESVLETAQFSGKRKAA